MGVEIVRAWKLVTLLATNILCNWAIRNLKILVHRYYICIYWFSRKHSPHRASQHCWKITWIWRKKNSSPTTNICFVTFSWIRRWEMCEKREENCSFIICKGNAVNVCWILLLCGEIYFLGTDRRNYENILIKFLSGLCISVSCE
jgi:hypothetical protein